MLGGEEDVVVNRRQPINGDGEVAQEDQQPAQQASIPTHPDDETRMTLSPDERRWALDIKRAVEALPEVDNLSDFLYSQLAIVHREDTEMAVEMATQLQQIREAFDIQDTFRSSIDVIRQFVDLYPGYLVAISFSDDSYVMIVDSSKKPTAREVRALRAGGTERFLHGIYVLFHILNSDFEAIRRGKYRLLLSAVSQAVRQTHCDIVAFPRQASLL